METKGLSEFLQKCNNSTVSQSEMYNFIKLYTNDFDKTIFDYLRSDLNKFTDNIKFTMIIENESDGTVDRHTTVYNYIEKQQEYLSLILTPRQKIDFVLNDIKEKDLNYYSDESIFTLEYNCFLHFCDMVETEYKKQNTKPTPSPKELKNIKITLPKIDDTKFNAKWIFDTYVNNVFKCSEECFNSWLKDGKQHPETIDFVLEGRQGKPAIAQLRKFIEKITGDAENTKDTYYKTVFGLEIKTAQLKTATNLNNTFKELKNYKLPNKPAK